MVSSLQRVLAKAKKERSLAGSGKRPRAEVKAPLKKKTSHAPDFQGVRQVALHMGTLLKNRCVCANPGILEGDFYKVLRTQIQHAVDEKEWKTIMVTSTAQDEGKTLTCINLAFSFSKAYDQSVLLIDADLKKQQVHKTLGIHSRYGLIDYLVHNQPIKDCLIRPEKEKLVFISGGNSVEGSSEVLGSRMMKAFVREARDRYEDRLVIFDVPPIMIGADALSFAPLVDGIVFVVRAGKTSTKQARNALDLLPQEKMIGVVLNGQKMSDKSYKYYYGRKKKENENLITKYIKGLKNMA